MTKITFDYIIYYLFDFYSFQQMRRRQQVGAVRGHAWNKREFPRESAGRGARKVSQRASPSPRQHGEEGQRLPGFRGVGGQVNWTRRKNPVVLRFNAKKKFFIIFLKYYFSVGFHWNKWNKRRNIFAVFLPKFFVSFCNFEKLETEPPFNVLSIFVDFENLMMFCLVWCHWK